MHGSQPRSRWRSRSRSPPNFPRPSERSPRSRSPSKAPNDRRHGRVGNTNEILHRKLAQIEENWRTPDKEKEVSFKKLEAAEEKLAEDVQRRWKFFANKPERHPKYSDEWQKFWVRKREEVKVSLKNPETYDYEPEWRAHWLKTVEELTCMEFERKIKVLRLQFGMDETLCKVEAKPSVKANADSAIWKPPFSEVKHNNDDLGTASGNNCNKTEETKQNASLEDREKDSSAPLKSSLPLTNSSIPSNGSPEGFDLIPLLRLMQEQDGQLSLLPPKMKIYFAKAEELELSKRMSSYTLLENQAFVELLFKCRDKFNGLINTGVLHQADLESLNQTVLTLDLILESQKCQTFHLKTTKLTEPKMSSSNVLPNEFGQITPLPTVPKSALDNDNYDSQSEDGSLSSESCSLEELLVELSGEQMLTIADFLSIQLDLTCRNNISREDLKDFLWEALQPATSEEARAITSEVEQEKSSCDRCEPCESDSLGLVVRKSSPAVHLSLSPRTSSPRSLMQHTNPQSVPANPDTFAPASQIQDDLLDTELNQPIKPGKRFERNRELIGLTVKIIDGHYKGSFGIVKDARGATVRIELHSSSQTILVDKTKTRPIGGSGGQTGSGSGYWA